MSFGGLSFLRQGHWRDSRYFLLHQRRDVGGRVAVINQELNRIGYIRILYARRDPDNPNSPMSELRVGLDVSPGTSLEHLLQAYIAQGGNPFDISMFLTPDSMEEVPVPGEQEVLPGEQEEEPDGPPDEPAYRETEPYGGLAHSTSTSPTQGGLYTGGWLPLWRYPPRRMGGNVSYADQAADMARTQDAARRWARAEIRALRTDLEARILKLCDLREQLIRERDELLATAVGGVVPGLFWDPAQFAHSYHLSAITELIDSVFYPLKPDGEFDFSSPRVTGPNPAFPTLLDDAPGGEEDWTSLG